VARSLRDRLTRGHTCSCSSRDCKGSYRTLRELQAHHIRQLPRWTGDKARKAARRMGKDVDRMRRHARSWLEAAGLIDHRGNRTAKGRARPEVRGNAPVRQLREAHRHDRDADRTDRRASRHERRATRADTRADRAAQRADTAKARGRDSAAARQQEQATRHRGRAAASRERVADTRMAHHQRWPERTPERTGRTR